MRGVIRSIPVLLAAVLAFAACAKPGEPCIDSPGSCKTKNTHLVCIDKKLVLATCKGAAACNDEGHSLVCDNTMADVGDGCSPEGARACSSDGKKELRCRAGSFQVEWGCRDGCALDASNNPKCAPTGEVGEVCRPDSIVCDGAKKTELACADGKLAARRTCNGSIGCETSPGGGVRCDRTKAVENEQCQEEGTGACDVAQKNVLLCRMGHFKTELHCLGALGCELPGNYSVRCDKSIVEPNEPCTEDGAVTCNTEGKQARCKEGAFQIDKSWKAKKGEPCQNRYRVSFETAKFEAR